MYYDVNKLYKIEEEIFKKAKTEKRMLNTTEMLVILESLQKFCQSQHYFNAVITCLKAHISKDVGFNVMLTNREEDIILLLGKGCCNDEISESLKISRLTVDTHRKNIKKKFKHVHRFNLTIFSFIYALQHECLERS